MRSSLSLPLLTLGLRDVITSAIHLVLLWGIFHNLMKGASFLAASHTYLG